MDPRFVLYPAISSGKPKTFIDMNTVPYSRNEYVGIKEGLHLQNRWTFDRWRFKQTGYFSTMSQGTGEIFTASVSVLCPRTQGG